MRGEEYSFETARLSVAEWHVQTGGFESGESLVEIVRGLLSSNVTEQLPDSWQGPYSEQRTVSWIHDRDEEGVQLLAVSSETKEPVALLLLHEASQAPAAELRVGYLVAESQWGKGFASELVGGLIDWARSQAFVSIVAGVAAANSASIRVLEKCGFTRVEIGCLAATELFYGIDLEPKSLLGHGGPAA